MGKEVEAALLNRGHTVAVRVDAAGGADTQWLDEQTRNGAEAVIEFSAAPAVRPNAETYTRMGIPAVVGTTGWESSRGEVRALIESAGIGYVAGSNFSIGAHIFFALVHKAALLINLVPEYDILGYEIHHAAKKDSPSGTALTMAERILSGTGRKKRIQTETVHRQIEPDELHVVSLRGGSFPGTHTVIIDSPADTVEIRHVARTRGGFALGAVMAAEWIIGKSGFFTVDDFVTDLLRSEEKA